MQGTDLDPVAEIATRSRIITRGKVIALVGLALLIAAAVLWSVFAQAPETIVGDGVIVPSTGYTEAGTRTVGVVNSVLVSPGDEVEAGQTLVTIDPQNPAAQRETVTAASAGVVVEVFARPGRPTALGQPLVILLPDSVESVTKAFMPAGQAETITPGMQALISPADAPRAQYGFIVGEVRSVAPAPVSRDRLLALLGDNDDLVDYLLSKGPVQEVTVTMNRAETPSGYEWTIAQGPNFAISSSTLASVAVVTSNRSVASWVLR